MSSRTRLCVSAIAGRVEKFLLTAIFNTKKINADLFSMETIVKFALVELRYSCVTKNVTQSFRIIAKISCFY